VQHEIQILKLEIHNHNKTKKETEYINL